MLLQMFDGVCDRVRMSPHSNMSGREAIGTAKPQMPQDIGRCCHQEARVRVDRGRSQWFTW